MTTTVSGSYPAVNSDSDATINGLTVGKGGGAVASNTALGVSALTANTSGSLMTAVGYQALQTNSTGDSNTAVGYRSLNKSTGTNCTAIGYLSGYNITSGGNNNAMGTQALYLNTTGASNTALGDFALYSNTTASNNTAVGYQAGYSNTTGTPNVFVGYQAGYANTTGGGNVVVGYQAYDAATTAGGSTIIGNRAGGSITTGQFNTIIGGDAGGALTTGASNCFIGATGAVASGEVMTTGSKNVIVGSYTGNLGGLDIRTASNYIVLSDGDGNPRQFTNASGFTKISNNGASGVLGITGTYHEVASDTNSNTLIAVNSNASYGGVCLQSDVARNTTNGSFQAFGYFNRGAGAYRMYVQDSGNLQNVNNSYGAISDIKLKENITDATPKLNKLMQVKVRNYNLKTDQTHKQIGVIAQELETVFPSLVEEFNDKDGDGNDLGTTTKAVKYSVFVPMLIKAIQELNAKVEAQALEIATLKGN